MVLFQDVVQGLSVWHWGLPLVNCPWQLEEVWYLLVHECLPVELDHRLRWRLQWRLRCRHLDHLLLGIVDEDIALLVP